MCISLMVPRSGKCCSYAGAIPKLHQGAGQMYSLLEFVDGGV
jgi:hypothetical protein